MRHPAVLLALTGIAAAPSFAQPLITAGAITDAAIPLAERTPTPSATATPRSGPFPPGAIVTMRDELENFPVGVSLGAPGVDAAPTSFTGPDGFDWGLNNLRGQGSAAFVRVVDLSGSPIGGNGTRAVRVLTAAAQAAGGFYTGANIRWQDALEPIPGADARVSAEMYLSTIDEQYTFEPTGFSASFFSRRLLWGGRCLEVDPGDCTVLGLPAGPITTIHSLTSIPSGFKPIFQEVGYCMDLYGTPLPGCTPPQGFSIGSPVPPPIGAWSRWAAETTADGRITYFIDRLDGWGEFAIHQTLILDGGSLNRLAWNTAFGSQDAVMLFDNIEASGPLLQLYPPALECPYHDDLEWMPPNYFVPWLPQSRWTAAPTSGAVVLDDFFRSNVFFQANTSPNNQHRREFSTELPVEHATLAIDLVVSFDARFDGDTVRAFALLDGDQTIARLFRGHEDRTTPGAPVYTPSLFVQTNRFFDPIDDPMASPDAVNPVIGVDIEDTGFVVPSNGQYHTITLRLSASGALRVSVGDTLVYAGPAAFGPSFDTLAFESENNASSPGSELRIDDVRMVCDAPSCATDFDFDGATSFADLNAALANFGVVQIAPGFLAGDANGDSTVNFEDLNAVLAAFGTSCD